MALEDKSSLFKKGDQFPLRNTSRVTGLVPNGGPAPSSFVGNRGGISSKTSLFSPKGINSRTRGVISTVTDSRRVRSSEPADLPTSTPAPTSTYFDIESNSTYYEDGYFDLE